MLSLSKHEGRYAADPEGTPTDSSRYREWRSLGAGLGLGLEVAGAGLAEVVLGRATAGRHRGARTVRRRSVTADIGADRLAAQQGAYLVRRQGLVFEQAPGQHVKLVETRRQDGP